MIRYEMTHRLGEAPVPIESENGEWVQYEDVKNNLITWHPVSEGLPEREGVFIVTLKNQCTDTELCVTTLRCDKRGFWGYGTEYYEQIDYTPIVTAWAEMPKPWEGQ